MIYLFGFSRSFSVCAQGACYTLPGLVAEIRDGISEEKVPVEFSKHPLPMIRAAPENSFNRQDEVGGTTLMRQRELCVSLQSC